MGLCLDRATASPVAKPAEGGQLGSPLKLQPPLLCLANSGPALPETVHVPSLCHCIVLTSCHPWRTGVEPGHRLSLGPHPSVPHSRSSRDPHPRGPWPGTPQSPEKLAPAGVQGVPGTFHLTFPLHLSILGPLHMNVYIRHLSFKFYSLYYLSFSFMFSVASMNKHHPCSAFTPNPVAFTQGPERHNHQPRESLD